MPDSLFKEQIIKMTIEASRKSIKALCNKYGLNEHSEFRRALEANKSMPELEELAKKEGLIDEVRYILAATNQTIKKISEDF